MFDEPQTTSANRTVAYLCRHAGMERPEAGFTLQGVVDLLTACEYQCNPDDLLRLVDRGRVNLADGCWCDAAIHQAIVHLEGSRRWLPGSKVHRMKKSAARLALEEQGDHKLRADVAERPLRELLLLLTETENRGIREGWLEAVTAKLALLEVNLDD